MSFGSRQPMNLLLAALIALAGLPGLAAAPASAAPLGRAESMVIVRQHSPSHVHEPSAMVVATTSDGVTAQSTVEDDEAARGSTTGRCNVRG